MYLCMYLAAQGNGNPLQCSCVENPRDGEAWWAAVYGVAQSQTRLKRLSSSSSTGPQFAACRLFSCGMWNLVSWPGIEPVPPCIGSPQSLIHWTTREVPGHIFSFFLRIYMGVELLGHVITLFNYLRTWLFPKAGVPFYVPMTSSIWGFQFFLHSQQHLLFSVFFFFLKLQPS